MSRTQPAWRVSVVASARLRLHGSVRARHDPPGRTRDARLAGPDRFVPPSGADVATDTRTRTYPPVGARPAGGAVGSCASTPVARGVR